MFSLSPYFDHLRPFRLLEQHFAEDVPSSFYRDFHHLNRLPPGFLRPWHSSLGDDKFEAHIDVQQFKPEEIKVSVLNNTVTVEGTHEERRDEHGYIARQFVRRYVLPEGHDADRVESRLSSDGVLTIAAPKLDQEVDKLRSVAVVETGKPPEDKEQKIAREE